MAIYLDNAATTKMDKSLIEVYQSFSCDKFYNPSAGYIQAIESSNFLDKAREVILKKLGAKCGDIIFTSGATEGNNLALRGSTREGKWEYIISAGEHPSVYNVAKQWELEGRVVHFLPLQKSGEIDYLALEKLVNEKTRLVSTMLVSNETGAINDIAKICKIVKGKNKNTVIHVDGVQGFCKIPFDISKWDIDFLTISGHKFHAPKGVGALYVKNKQGLKNIIYGGGQEFGVRSGTENLPSIMAMVEEVNKIDVLSNLSHVIELKNIFVKELNNERIKIIDGTSPYICSISFKGVNGETLMRALENEVIIGTGSACSTKKAGNRVLESMGFDKDYIKSSVRVSFDFNQTCEEVLEGARLILEKYYEILERVK